MKIKKITATNSNDLSEKIINFMGTGISTLEISVRQSEGNWAAFITYLEKEGK